MIRRLLSIVILTCCATACVSYPPDTPPRGYSQGSPNQSINYLKWSFENESALHMSKSLTMAFMKAEEISPSLMDANWRAVTEWVNDSIGDVNAVKISDPIYESPDGRLRIVDATSPQRSARVWFVLESRYKFTPFDLLDDNAEGEFTSMNDILKYEEKTAVIRLPNLSSPGSFPAESIHRIVIESAWRIDAIRSDGQLYGNKNPAKLP